MNKPLLLLVILAAISPLKIVMAQHIPGDAYSMIGYSEIATNNPVADLAKQLNSGELTLQYQGHRGYLDSLLQALEIDPSTQLLIFSKTSLQHELISPTTPRAIYFSDDTYIGWVQESNIIEVATVDSKLGAIFYIFNNVPTTKTYFERANQSCLVCHDSSGTMGGGVPLLMTLSSIYTYKGVSLLDISNDYYITDQTPIRDRWGGWYVTGQHGKQVHLGNLLLQGPEQLENFEDSLIGNLDSLSELGFLDVSPYLTDTSDIVALMILEHQISVQNHITYVKFKAPAVLGRLGFNEAASSPTWAELPARAQIALTRMLNELIDAMLMIDATEFEDSISGSPIFEAAYLAQGRKDELGRSLRDLDLNKHLFKYPMSFIIYSENFDTLPAYAKDYVYLTLVEILQGRNASERYSQLSANDRQTILDILNTTKADFTAYTGLKTE